MPRVRWGIDAGTVDDFDREGQYKPYMGPVPPNGVYQWKVKQLKSVAGTRDKHPQLRAGLELVPRKGRDEAKYKGYYVMVFMPITEKTNFRYTPFLDALGVTGRDFTDRTIADEEGNVKKIGRWRHDGSTEILGQLAERPDDKGILRKDITWMGSLDGDSEPELDDDDDDEEYVDDGDVGYSRKRKTDDDDDEEMYEDEYIEEEEEAPAPRRSVRKPAASRSRVPASRRRARRDDDEGDPF